MNYFHGRSDISEMAVLSRPSPHLKSCRFCVGSTILTKLSSKRHKMGHNASRAASLRQWLAELVSVLSCEQQALNQLIVASRLMPGVRLSKTLAMTSISYLTRIALYRVNPDAGLIECERIASIERV